MDPGWTVPVHLNQPEAADKITSQTTFSFQLKKPLSSWPEENRDFEVGQKVEEHC